MGRPQRVGLAPGEREGAHQQGVGALPARLGGRGPGGVGHQVGGRAAPGTGAVDPQGEPLVGEVAAQLGQRHGVGRQRLDVGELVEGGAPPQGQGPAERGDAFGAEPGHAVAAARARRVGPGAEVRHVELAGPEGEPVGAPVPDQAVARRPEVPPQPRDVAVQGAGARLGRLGRPQGVDQLARRHRPRRRHGQQREHGPAPGAAHVDRPAVDRQPEGAEQVDPDRDRGSVRHRRRRPPRCERPATAVQPVPPTIGP